MQRRLETSTECEQLSTRGFKDAERLVHYSLDLRFAQRRLSVHYRQFRRLTLRLCSDTNVLERHVEISNYVLFALCRFGSNKGWCCGEWITTMDCTGLPRERTVPTR